MQSVVILETITLRPRYARSQSINSSVTIASAATTTGNAGSRIITSA